MKKEKISVELMVEIKKMQEEEQSIRVGLDHFAERLQNHRKAFWKMVEEAIPQARDWVSTVNTQDGEITFLYPKSKSFNITDRDSDRDNDRDNDPEEE